MNSNPAITAFLAEKRERQEAFLAELVRTPSDNPPGDCAPHADRTAALLEGFMGDHQLNHTPICALQKRR